MVKNDIIKQFSLTDVKLIVQLIDICAARGAFKGEELADIGGLRNKAVEIGKIMNAETLAKASEESE